MAEPVLLLRLTQAGLLIGSELLCSSPQQGRFCLDNARRPFLQKHRLLRLVCLKQDMNPRGQHPYCQGHPGKICTPRTRSLCSQPRINITNLQSLTQGIYHASRHIWRIHSWANLHVDCWPCEDPTLSRSTHAPSEAQKGCRKGHTCRACPTHAAR